MDTKAHVATMMILGMLATLVGSVMAAQPDGLFEPSPAAIAGPYVASAGGTLILTAWVLHVITGAIHNHAKTITAATKPPADVTE